MQPVFALMMRAFAFLPLLASAAQDVPEFRVDVNFVGVAATVRNTSGTLVTNLTQDDFEILEDGAPQQIRVFARRTEIPLNLGLIVDTSGSQSKFVKRHRRDLKEFLKNALELRDRAFLLCFGNRLRLVSDYGNDSERMIDDLEEFEDNGRKFPLLGPEEERVLGTALFDSLYYSIEKKLRDAVIGRRAVIVFTDGEENSSGHDLLDVIESAQSADVVIYPIRYTENEGKRLTVRNRYGMRVLRHLAEHTGGAHFDAVQKGMRESFRAITEELRSAYELGYLSSQPERDGTFRKIQVRIKRPGLVARSRPGYYAR